MSCSEKAKQLTEMAEACDIVSDRPMTESGREFWRKKRDIMRQLADEFFTQSEILKSKPKLIKNDA